MDSFKFVASINHFSIHFGQFERRTGHVMIHTSSQNSKSTVRNENSGLDIMIQETSSLANSSKFIAVFINFDIASQICTRKSCVSTFQNVLIIIAFNVN